MKYRSEVPFGEGYRNAAEVICYEIFELGNTDILDTLLEKTDYINDIKLRNLMAQIADELEENGFVDDMPEDEKLSFAQTIVDEISTFTNKDIKYVLWLADKDVVMNYYGRGELLEEDIDAYEESDVILSDCGYDGCLYGYEEMPVPVKELEEREGR